MVKGFTDRQRNVSSYRNFNFLKYSKICLPNFSSLRIDKHVKCPMFTWGHQRLAQTHKLQSVGRLVVIRLFGPTLNRTV